MMDRTFWAMTEPSEWDIDGYKVRMLFTLRTAARLEQLLGKPWEEIIFEMLQTDKDGAQGLPPMAMERQAQVVLAVMQEAGEQVTLEQLMGLHMQRFTALARAAQAEILLKLPRGGKKKAPVSPGTGGNTSTQPANA